MASAHVSQHPLIRHKLSALRDVATKPAEFRSLVKGLSSLLAYEACADLPMEPVTVTTPLAACPSHLLAGHLAIVPILRAGLGMADGILELLPDAQVWHIGLYRDELTLMPVEYYNKLPSNPGFEVALVADPMLATGGSAVQTCKILKDAGVKRIKYLGLIAAPEGIEKLDQEMPDVEIYVCVIDSHLNEVGYIFPGLGDAGDRQFATGSHS